MIARETAPEIDRLVLSVSRAVGPADRERLAGLAEACGLDSLELLPHYEDFLLAGTLTREIAVLRTRYRPPAQVLARLDELEQKELIAAGPSGLTATALLRPLLRALLETRQQIASDLWSGHATDVATTTRWAGDIAAAASADHVVAVAHRALPEPDDPFLLLAHRLLGLRYVRQHDHAAAWLGRGLTPPEMVALTELWQGHATGHRGDGLAGLVDRGYAAGEPPVLTDAGRDVRDAVELETNERAQRSFDALDHDAGAEFLAALRRLPGDELP